MRTTLPSAPVALCAIALLGIGVAAAQGKPAGKPTARPPAAASASQSAPPLPAPAEAAAPAESAKPAPAAPPPTGEVAPVPPAFQGQQDPMRPPSAVQLPPQGPPAVVWPSPQPMTTNPAEPEQPEPPAKPWTTRDLSKNFWQIGLGVRHSWIKDAGFDPFASNDSLLQGSVFATRSVLVVGDFAVGAGLMFEGGGRSGTARGASTNLTVLRPGVIVEARYNVVRNLYLGIRAVPQAVYSEMRVEERSAPASMQQNDWRFGLDATAHAGWNFLRMMGVRATVPEWWLLADVGYGFTQKKDMNLKPDLGDSDPRSSERLNLGKNAYNGVLMRVAIAVTF